MGQLCPSLALLQHLSHSLYCFEGVFYHKLEGVDVAEILDEIVGLLNGFDASKTILFGCLDEQNTSGRNMDGDNKKMYHGGFFWKLADDDV